MSRTANRALLAVALEQGGYFTARQARDVGYDYPHLDYHVRAGNFVRVGHGLYRFPELPAAEHDDLFRLSLWSRDRADEPQAVASHETALVVHELSDVLPAKVHLTVPSGFRKKPPIGCVLHRASLRADEIMSGPGFRLTAPLRTLVDAMRGGVGREQIEQAVRQALERGLVRRSRVEAEPALRGIVLP